jgi:hypothetical protein
MWRYGIPEAMKISHYHTYEILQYECIAIFQVHVWM